jgi:peptidoglycan/xylan/chitin deacetylase (PgdA/CDA1 family)
MPLVCYIILDDYNEEVLEDPSRGALEVCVLHFPNFKVNLAVSAGKTIPENPYPDKFAYVLHGWSHRYWDEMTDEQLEEWPYDKIYRPPYWMLNDEMYERLVKHGYMIINGLDDPRNGTKYNWDIKDPPDLTKKVLFGHGHITQAPNNIADKLGNVFMLPKDTEFRFLRDWGKP